MKNNGFYTLRGYRKMDGGNISAAMEDYLEMICRLVRKYEFVRVNQLAALLNVTPPASSKMVNKLREKGLVKFEPYGVIRLTGAGKEYGTYLLERHAILHRFFCMVNETDNELELVEKIEHFMDVRTVLNIQALLERMEQTHITV